MKGTNHAGNRFFPCLQNLALGVDDGRPNRGGAWRHVGDAAQANARAGIDLADGSGGGPFRPANGGSLPGPRWHNPWLPTLPGASAGSPAGSGAGPWLVGLEHGGPSTREG